MALRLVKAFVLMTVTLLACGCGRVAHGPRYVREIRMPEGARGEVCMALDARVFEHAVSASLAGLQVRETKAGSVRTVPWMLTESGTASGATEAAPVSEVRAQTGELNFSLSMPPRPYSAVDLGLQLRNFVGVADVSAVDAQGRDTWLGERPVFDETSLGLGRSTRIELAEETFPTLQVKLRLWTLDRRPMQGVGANVVVPAWVPPSRESQTVFTTVAATDDIVALGNAVTAELQVPKHVPVERVALQIQDTDDFLRDVNVTAKGDEGADKMYGSVSRVHLRVADGKGLLYERSTVEAVLAANVRRSAQVVVIVQGKLPVHRVELQMRERKVCFSASSGKKYELAYGGLQMAARAAANERNAGERAGTVPGVLGDERIDDRFAEEAMLRGRWRTWLNSQPELVWVLTLGVIAWLAARMRVHLRRGRRA